MDFRTNFVAERCAIDSRMVFGERRAMDSPIVSPFATPPLSEFPHLSHRSCSKKDPSEFRLIHHLFYPQGSCVNDFIPDHCCTVKYASVGDATKSIQRLGRGCFMAKTDVKSAFRIIPIYPSH